MDTVALEGFLTHLYAPKPEATLSTAINYVYSFVGIAANPEEIKQQQSNY